MPSEARGRSVESGRAYDRLLLLERLESLLEDMEELEIGTVSELRVRIAHLHAELDDEERV